MQVGTGVGDCMYLLTLPALPYQYLLYSFSNFVLDQVQRGSRHSATLERDAW